MRAPTVFDVTCGSAYGGCCTAVALWCAVACPWAITANTSVRRLGRYARAAGVATRRRCGSNLRQRVDGGAGRQSWSSKGSSTALALRMALYAFIFSLIMALLYFAHLRRSLGHEQAAARLVAAQTAQRHARRGMVQARLQEMQARVDPQLLFEMLDTVRRLYERDAARAERFLDELIVFLRAALPRLRIGFIEPIARGGCGKCFRQVARAGKCVTEVGMTVDIAPDVMHVRFPPGVLVATPGYHR